MPTDPADDDEETLAAFTRLLEKIGPTWLDKLRPASATPSSPKPDPEGQTLTSFLQAALNKSEKQIEKMAAQLEAMREVLTPEQLTLLKSLKTATPPKEGVENPGPPSNEPPVEPPAKPKRNWL